MSILFSKLFTYYLSNIYSVIYDCPAGRYGRASQLNNALCSGLCAKGHYCPAGSVTSTQYPCPIGITKKKLLKFFNLFCLTMLLYKWV